MSVLKDILYQVHILEIVGDRDIEISRVDFDSRAVDSNGLFVAVRGTQVDGHKYIDKAIESGAKAVVCEELPEDIQQSITYVKVDSSADALGIIASNYYGNPSEKIKLIGVTGTNGKTSIATLLFRLFRKLGYKCGLLSTVQNQIQDEVLSATHTTPDAVSLNRLLSTMVERGVTHCFMEVSSHALDQGRVSGVTFSGAVFTNITRDHLDYHPDFSAYIHAKKKLFDGLSGDAFALVNRDDKNGMVMVQNTNATPKTYALNASVDYQARLLENTFDGLLLEIQGLQFHTHLIGKFNAYNILACFAVANELGEDHMDVLTALSAIQTAEGRFEHFRTPKDGITCIVDYAHTPDALKNVLETILQIRSGNQEVITVVGCGGDRDPGKRPVMGLVACEYSDRAIFTSDNPRSEDPESIIEQMFTQLKKEDLGKVVNIANRKSAIKTAVMSAKKGDVLLVAGKGHEKYQEINGEKHPFDDFEELKKAIAELDR